MKKPALLVSAALLIGCGGDSDKDSQPTTGSATVSTKDALRFMQQNLSGNGRLGSPVTCADFFAQVSEQEYGEQPRINNVFDFHHTVNLTQCVIGEAYANQDNLYLKGAFNLFSLATDGSSDINVVTSCSIMKIPMHNGNGGNFQCLAGDYGPSVMITTQGLSLGTDGILRFVSKNETAGKVSLMEYDGYSDQAIEVAEINFTVDESVSSPLPGYYTYVTDGNKVLIAGNGPVYDETITDGSGHYETTAIYSNGALDYYRTTKPSAQGSYQVDDFAITYELKGHTTITNLNRTSENDEPVYIQGFDTIYAGKNDLFMLRTVDVGDGSLKRGIYTLNPHTGETTLVNGTKYFSSVVESDLNGESVFWVTYSNGPVAGPQNLQKLAILNDDLSISQHDDLLNGVINLDGPDTIYLDPIAGGVKAYVLAGGGNIADGKLAFLSNIDGVVMEEPSEKNSIESITRIIK
ncbi:hypothetical protein [Vibrio comitans]|uniref:Lipoprotein n=1 Tax=Vibrio comitans NBRC 102076 TaxID=1219078 RepID=A0A4Y3IHN9_9VIBR|nr:hypothetical protein [Vibrio comitans]GEA58901.1 hypothetical protein VCO01S_00940 [Vibrio comitans NBRC 102076]